MERASLLVFFGITLLHSIVQFLAWSAAPGNMPREAGDFWLGKLWPVMSFPTFWVVPSAWSDSYFWATFLTNSVLWGLAGALAIFLLKKLV